MVDVFFKRINYQQLLKEPQVILDLLEKANFKENIKKDDFLGIKVHFGERGNKSFVNPNFLLPLVRYLKNYKTKPFLFDTNTLYYGDRMNAIDHISLAKGHGFDRLGIPIIIGDGLRGNDYVEVEINKKHFNKCYLSLIWKDIDFILCLSHFKGHMLTGFGGAIKNLGMGIASRRGKLAQHCEIYPYIDKSKCKGCGICFNNCPSQCIEKDDDKFRIVSKLCIGCGQCMSLCPFRAIIINWSDSYTLIQERVVEYAFASLKGKRSIHINFCVFITKECDCMNKEEKGYCQDLGLLLSYDPVALDKASLDLLIDREKRDIFKEIHPETPYSEQFTYAEEIGLGTTDYRLIEV
ncbi:MAG: DUF362 domain-containing protein [Candidatus Omnitrophica bacterium]|nr:DUF362 domain-containing protein [Candidatus Omnitrophota bacterium]MCM8825958.1 DUF362 domain-containing protein [Candidatus Omnitrophota bacterium]